MTTNLLLRTAEAPRIRRRVRKLVPFAVLGACAFALGGCASSDLGLGGRYAIPPGAGQSGDGVQKVQSTPDHPFGTGAAQRADGVQQAQATEAAPDANAPALKPVPKQDPSAPSIWNGFGLWAVPKPPPPPADSLVVRPDGLTPEKAPEEGTVEARLAGARDLFRRGEYAQAQVQYHTVGQETKAPAAAIQEGLFYEAECLRLQSIYPRAADTYNELLNKYPSTPYRDQAVQHMFDIANYWLDDTRQEMQEYDEYKEGKRLFFVPHMFNWDKTKPILDTQGRAVEKLEQVRLNDINGPLADQALFYAGSVKMYNGDWREADNYFTQIYEHHPNSKLAPKAVEYAIMAKNLSTGGPEYDGRRAAEARKLVDAALRNYPELANDDQKREFLLRQLAGINLQQAAKDYDMAAFWDRQGHPGAAYFQFRLVEQRYPNTKYADDAKKRADELYAQMQKTGGDEPPKPPPPPEKAPSGVIPASLPAMFRP